MNLTPQGMPNLKQGNTVGVGRPKGSKNRPGVLDDFRHVYTKPESEDRTEEQKAVRSYRKECPREFLRLIVQMELKQKESRRRSKDRREARGKQEDSSEAGNEGMTEDEGYARMSEWLKRVREEFDHERAVDVPVQVGVAADNGGVGPTA